MHVFMKNRIFGALIMLLTGSMLSAVIASFMKMQSPASIFLVSFGAIFFGLEAFFTVYDINDDGLIPDDIISLGAIFISLILGIIFCIIGFVSIKSASGLLPGIMIANLSLSGSRLVAWAFTK